MKKAIIITVTVYFIVASAVMLTAFLSNGETLPPVILSFALLVPLYLWQRKYAERAKLSKAVNGKTLKAVVGWSLMLFFLALIVRVPSALIFNMPYEKAPLIFLLTLTILLVERADLSLFGFKTNRLVKALFYGVVYFVILQGTILFVHCIAVYALTSQVAVLSFNIALFLMLMPFHTLLVGVSEEGLFRGYIQTSMERFGRLKAVLFQAVLFGLWHFVWDLSPFNPFGMLRYITFTFLFGLLFGYFYAKIRNLAPLILVHGLWNSFQSGLIMNDEALGLLAQFTPSTQILVWILPYAVAVLFVLVFTKNWVKEV